MSVSETQICNNALLKYGDLTITSINADDKRARTCKVIYPIIRDRMLYLFPWNFAMKRADISAQLSTTPAFQWDYAYTLPTDCLRAWEFYSTSGEEPEWQVENGKLLTNQDSEIYIRYISQVTETGRFNPCFVNCVVVALAAELSAKLAGDKGRNKRAQLIEELEKIELPRAYQMNAIEGSRQRRSPAQSLDQGNYSWQSVGHSGDILAEDKVFST